MSESEIISLKETIGNVQKDVAMIRQDVATTQKDVAVMESTVTPLVLEMKASTKATNNLTTKLSELILTNNFMQTALDEVKIITGMNDKRLKVLEDVKSSKRSGDKVKEFFIKSIVSTIVPFILFAVGYLLYVYFNLKVK